MEQILYWIGGIMVTIIGYFLNKTLNKIIDDLKETKKEIDRVKDTGVENKGRIDLLQNNHTHLTKTLDDLYSLMKEIISEVKDINKRIK